MEVFMWLDPNNQYPHIGTSNSKKCISQLHEQVHVYNKGWKSILNEPLKKVRPLEGSLGIATNLAREAELLAP